MVSLLINKELFHHDSARIALIPLPFDRILTLTATQATVTT
jgi:uncharacterized protein (DUF697 family)